jgi:predicted transcriptional regulator
MKTYLLYPNEAQEKMIADFIEANNIAFFEDEEDELPQHVLDGIKAGQEDAMAGRMITLEQFKQKLSSSK